MKRNPDKWCIWKLNGLWFIAPPLTENHRGSLDHPVCQGFGQIFVNGDSALREFRTRAIEYERNATIVRHWARCQWCTTFQCSQESSLEDWIRDHETLKGHRFLGNVGRAIAAVRSHGAWSPFDSDGFVDPQKTKGFHFIGALHEPSFTPPQPLWLAIHDAEPTIDDLDLTMTTEEDD